MARPEDHLPKDLTRHTEEICRLASAVEGYLHPEEMQLLALLGAVPTAAGEILEIGSYKGKSAVILALAARLGDNATVNAVDPMTSPSVTDPDLKGAADTLGDFEANVRRAGVEGRVRLHKMLSAELAPGWRLPLRLLWIDGDHLYAGTRADLEGFEPHLADGAIVAIHDVLHLFDGGIRVFAENILLSPNYGAFGFCGSTAWAQFSKAGDTGQFIKVKEKYYKRLARLIPFHAFPGEMKGLRKRRYELYKSLVPHGPVDPEKWIAAIDIKR